MINSFLILPPLILNVYKSETSDENVKLVIKKFRMEMNTVKIKIVVKFNNVSIVKKKM